jgi:uncharacterized protein (TIGR00375 family)
MMILKSFFADLHVHIGMSEKGKWIKIPTSSRLTVKNIGIEAMHRKGIEIIGIVDAVSPQVLADLSSMIDEEILKPHSGGGYSYKDKLTLLLGAEIETTEPNGGMAHTLIYLPDIQSMRKFSQVMSQFIRNINLSSQNAHMTLERLISISREFEAAIVPAHVFTPYKSLYGTCCNRLTEILSDQAIGNISAIEIGLSADSLLADRIEELTHFTLLTNSDAHSLEKIAREYNVLSLANPSFQEFVKAMGNKDGRAVKENYGLNPLLGKYHNTLCGICGSTIVDTNGEHKCLTCGSEKLIKGVFDRIEELADFIYPRHPQHRGPYYYQIPLEYIPGIGKKVLAKLLGQFGTEMNVIHYADEVAIAAVVGKSLAKEIIKARSGVSTLRSGGGGVFGKIIKDKF